MCEVAKAGELARAFEIAATSDRGRGTSSEREFGGRLAPVEQQAVADALAGFWRDDLESPPTAG